MSLSKSAGEYRTIITDMDGTLYFQLPVRLCMVLEMLCHFWRLNDFLIIRRYRQMTEQGIPEQERFEHLPAHAPRVVNEWMQQRPLKYIHRFRDRLLVRMLNERQEKGAKIIVYSDYPAVSKVKAVGLALGTESIFCATDREIQCLKPDPRGLLNILKLTGTPRGEALFIGDRYVKDGRCAEEAGVDFVILGKTKLSRKITGHVGLI